MVNTKPCGTCKHLDARRGATGGNYCWERYEWHDGDEVVAACGTYGRADGKPPPGRITFRGERL